MGRILTLLGVVMLLAGLGGILYSSFSSFGAFGSASGIDQLIATPSADTLCKPGETLDVVQGASSYTPGSGSGRPTSYFCVDADGNRRDVTGDFVDDLFGSAGGFVGGLFNGILGTFLWGGLMTLGIIFMVFGMISRRMSGKMPTIGGGVVLPTGTYTSGTVLGSSSAPYTPPPSPSFGTPAAGKTPPLAERLKQLEDARAAGLISQEEYERLRQQALNG